MSDIPFKLVNWGKRKELYAQCSGIGKTVPLIIWTLLYSTTIEQFLMQALFFPFLEHCGICQVPVQILLLLHYWNVYGFRFVYIWGNSLQSSPTFT